MFFRSMRQSMKVNTYLARVYGCKGYGMDRGNGRGMYTCFYFLGRHAREALYLTKKERC